MFRVDTMAMLSMLLLGEDIMRLFSYYLRKGRMSMLREENMAMLPRLLLREDMLELLCNYHRRAPMFLLTAKSIAMLSLLFLLHFGIWRSLLTLRQWP